MATKREIPKWAVEHPQEMLRLLTKSVCPACGDTMHKRRCDNHSDTCGQDWNEIYKTARREV